MKHDFIDRYSRLQSPVHDLDPRAKTLALFALIIACVLTPPDSWYSFCVYAGVVLIIAVASNVPMSYLLTRMLVVLPFVLAVAVFVPFMHPGGPTVDLGPFSVSRAGLLVLWGVIIKALISVSCLILLSSTTHFSDLMHGLERLHVPRFFTVVSAFMYRYLFIIVDEAERMKRARDSRNFQGRWIWQAKVIGHVVASLFLRSQERAERVYQAMTARGFDGHFPRTVELRMRTADYFFMAVVIAIAAGGRVVAIWA
ncbi:MAG: cobalt ECF transporter T component CbiQ [Actinomycetota bacterium]